MITMDLKEIGNILLVIGKTEGHIDQSIFARSILDEKNGPPPEINLFNENTGETLLKLIDNNFIKSAHDVSLGGIITAVSKMCIKGNKGVNLKKPNFLIMKLSIFLLKTKEDILWKLAKNLKKLLIFLIKTQFILMN